MMLKRRTLPYLCALFVLAWAGATQAQTTYLLSGSSGGQNQIGNGLPLPIQVTMTDPTAVTRDWGATPSVPLPAGTGPPLPVYTTSATDGMGAPLVHGPGGSVFPPLLIPVRPDATVMGTAGGGLTIPKAVLSKPLPTTPGAGLETVGVNVQNSSLHAVATRLGFKWPATTVMLGYRTMTPTIMYTGGGAKVTGTVTLPVNPGVTVYKATTPGNNKIRYRNPGMTATGFFGGVARFNFTWATMTGGTKTGVTPGMPVTAGPILSSAPVTVYLLAGTPPPCTGCGGLLAKALPANPGAGGATAGLKVQTPGGPVPQPNIWAIKAGASPKGTISVLFGPFTNGPIVANTATSYGYPWTTGRITVSAPGALGGERFVLSGNDGRGVDGAGTIQLVAGSLSQRTASMENANRAWVVLDLGLPSEVPSFTNMGLLALCGSLLAIAGSVAVRRSRRVEA